MNCLVSVLPRCNSLLNCAGVDVERGKISPAERVGCLKSVQLLAQDRHLASVYLKYVFN